MSLSVPSFMPSWRYTALCEDFMESILRIDSNLHAELNADIQKELNLELNRAKASQKNKDSDVIKVYTRHTCAALYCCYYCCCVCICVCVCVMKRNWNRNTWTQTVKVTPNNYALLSFSLLSFSLLSFSLLFSSIGGQSGQGESYCIHTLICACKVSDL